MITTSMTPMAAPVDAELVRASLAGDREAFGQIVARYQSLLCALAYSATGNLGQSEDLAQETFLAAWKHLAELREPAKLRAWLCGIARNLIHTSWRTQEREPSHGAQPLDTLPETRSPEPLPVERAITEEEAAILWRSLERVPDNYRLPLVLFYREHRSVEEVAHDLDLTEDAVKQRLSRGRKLLHEEVMSFVESALEKSSPGKAFTVAVLAALPSIVGSAQAASIGMAAAKGSALTKGTLSLGALGAFVSMVGAVVLSWKNAVDETKSPAERRLMVRTGWFQIVFLTLSLAAGLYGLPRLGQHPIAMGCGLGVLLLANLVNGVLLFDLMGRRRTQIVLEEGTWADAGRTGVPTEREAWRKAAKLCIPFILLFLFGSIGLPWKEHPGRCAAIVAGEGLIIAWAFFRFGRMLSDSRSAGLWASKFQAIVGHPIVLLPLVVFGSALLGGGVTLFLHPGAAAVMLHNTPWLRNWGFALFAAFVVYAVFAGFYLKKRGFGLGSEISAGEGTSRAMAALMGSRFLSRTGALMAKVTLPLVGQAMLKQYSPFFEQTPLSSDQQEQLKALIQKKQVVNADKGLALMNPKLPPDERAAFILEMKAGREACDAEIRQLLGPEQFRAFEQFEKSIPDRLILGLFASKSARLGHPLTADQQSQILAALTEARARYNWSTDLSRRIMAPADPVEMFSPENIDVFAREEEEFENQFVQQAAVILTPPQISEFKPFLGKQRQAKVASMRMTARMFNPAVR